MTRCKEICSEETLVDYLNQRDDEVCLKEEDHSDQKSKFEGRLTKDLQYPENNFTHQWVIDKCKRHPPLNLYCYQFTLMEVVEDNVYYVNCIEKKKKTITKACMSYMGNYISWESKPICGLLRGAYNWVEDSYGKYPTTYIFDSDDPDYDIDTPLKKQHATIIGLAFLAYFLTLSVVQADRSSKDKNVSR